MIAYHASNKRFDKFSTDYANTREHKEQFNALWFSTDKDYVQQFGKYLYKVNIKGNFIKEEQFDLAEKLSNEFCKINNIKGYEDYGMMLETKHGQAFADFLVEKGYDGYIFPQHKGKTIIVFNPDCCKILGTLKEELTLSADDFEDFVIGGEKYNKELQIEESLNEKFEELEPNLYATKYSSDILKWMKNKPKQYRVVFDKNINYYFIADAFNYIHLDLLEAAYRSGFYPELYSENEVQDYIDENLNIDTLDFEGSLLFFAFAPKGTKTMDLEKSSDGYTRKYVYDFGTIYCHELSPLENFSIYKDLGEPLEKKDIFENIYERLNEELQPFLEDYRIEKLSNGFVKYQNGYSIGGYIMQNTRQHNKWFYIELSPTAYNYLKNTKGSGFITSGAEGNSHATIKGISHENGNKIDVQPLNGRNSSLIDYAELCVNFLNNEKTAYINLESFSANEVKIIKDYIYKNYPDLKEYAESKAKYSPNSNRKICDGKILTSVKTAYSKHLDIGILP